MSDFQKKDVLSYYTETSMDYGEWSKEYNMHFGYYKFPMNPFRREQMLETMNLRVFDHLQMKEEDMAVLDLGCGLGATCRSFAKAFPEKKIQGITLVPWQVEKATELNKQKGFDKNIEIVQADYTKLSFAGNTADAVYALESSCHCEGLDKAAFIKEMMRVLKPGKHFVIVDGFVKKDPKQFNSLLRYCYETICKGWALPSFPHLGYMKEALEKEGAEDIEIENLSWRIAPSVLHAPSTVIYFMIRKMLQGEKLNRVRLGHLKACLLALVLGAHRRSFGYFMISGRKK